MELIRGEMLQLEIKDNCIDFESESMKPIIRKFIKDYIENTGGPIFLMTNESITKQSYRSGDILLSMKDCIGCCIDINEENLLFIKINKNIIIPSDPYISSICEVSVTEPYSKKIDKIDNLLFLYIELSKMIVDTKLD